MRDAIRRRNSAKLHTAPTMADGVDFANIDGESGSGRHLLSPPLPIAAGWFTRRKTSPANRPDRQSRRRRLIYCSSRFDSRSQSDILKRWCRIAAGEDRGKKRRRRVTTSDDEWRGGGGYKLARVVGGAPVAGDLRPISMRARGRTPEEETKRSDMFVSLIGVQQRERRF